MKKSIPGVNLAQIQVSDKVLPLYKCIVIASNLNYVAITNSVLIQEFILYHASCFQMHLWTILSSALWMKTNVSWNHPLQFGMFRRTTTGYTTSPIRPQQTATYSVVLVLGPSSRSRNHFKWFQNSVMTTSFSLLALLRKKIIPCFSIQRSFLKCKATHVIVIQEPLGCMSVSTLGHRTAE